MHTHFFSYVIKQWLWNKRAIFYCSLASLSRYDIDNFLSSSRFFSPQTIKIQFYFCSTKLNLMCIILSPKSNCSTTKTAALSVKCQQIKIEYKKINAIDLYRSISIAVVTSKRFVFLLFVTVMWLVLDLIVITGIAHWTMFSISLLLSTTTIFFCPNIVTLLICFSFFCFKFSFVLTKEMIEIHSRIRVYIVEQFNHNWNK